MSDEGLHQRRSEIRTVVTHINQKLEAMHRMLRIRKNRIQTSLTLPQRPKPSSPKHRAVQNMISHRRIIKSPIAQLLPGKELLRLRCLPRVVVNLPA
jgi:hypothetical protein